jgi:hypothetical protein
MHVSADPRRIHGAGFDQSTQSQSAVAISIFLSHWYREGDNAEPRWLNDQVAAIAMFNGHNSQILFMIKLPSTFFSNLTEVSNAAAATFRHKGPVLV